MFLHFLSKLCIFAFYSTIPKKIPFWSQWKSERFLTSAIIASQKLVFFSWRLLVVSMHFLTKAYFFTHFHENWSGNKQEKNTKKEASDRRRNSKPKYHSPLTQNRYGILRVIAILFGKECEWRELDFCFNFIHLILQLTPQKEFCIRFIGLQC